MLHDKSRNENVARSPVLVGVSLVLLGISSALASTLPRADPEDHGVRSAQVEALNNDLRSIVESGTVRGVSLLVAHRGEVIFRESFGKLDVDRRVQISSATKPLSATAFMLAAERYDFSIDDPIGKHLPQFNNVTLEDGSPPALRPTIRQILSHSSGITSQGLRDLRGEIGHMALVTRTELAQVVERMAADPLAFEPGTGFYYSEAYDLIARVIEIHAAIPYRLFFHRELLQPLGLDNTDFLPKARTDETARLTPPSSGQYVATGSGLVSTLDDLGVFLDFHRQRASGTGPDLLSPQAVREMNEPRQRVLGETADSFGAHYGYGWFLALDADGDARTSSHGGASGAMLWIDWDLDVIGVFLAPGTHISELLPAIRQSHARVRGWFE